MVVQQNIMNIGIIGCGNISKTYLTNAALFPSVKVTAVADIRRDAAEARGAEFGVPARSVAELLADPSIGAVVNLTIPAAHVEVGMQILEAGKHAYLEKPLAVDLASGRRLLEYAASRGLRVGCAPDTFMGAGQQTARHLLDAGAIGEPLSGSVFMMFGGPEGWHPNPSFFYQPGGGPMLDRGPYYMATLVNLFGPVKSIMGSCSRGYAERTCGAEAIRGQRISVEISTHVTGVLTFHSGPVITVAFSFDVKDHTHRHIEIYGTKGSMSVPDPNMFGGDVLVKVGGTEWVVQPHTHPYAENSRMIGLVDLLEGAATGRTGRCDGGLAYHALEIMLAFEQSHCEGRRIDLESRPERPAAMPGLSGK